MASGGEPDYGLDERKAGYVRVRVEIPDLKAKGRNFMNKIIGGRRDEASNAKVECNFEERSFILNVAGEKDLNGKSWTMERPMLPFNIDPYSSYCETEKGFVNIFLKKECNDDDWSTFIRKGDLSAN
ncbi:hypothetical protein C0Q70_16051 [Pomacea canaliculata]|uniref:CS domain-containing protein n=1 Tax=Pomacea canaliculata TaxID=400727 RepID=A0A2T7NNP4_POMCA|nr:uncharacterized protein LOC112573601 [Pomacea canaliculata]PVD22795.1 hypothetical protein C0Q70_16051 [Pomacea canaliculata]